MSEVLNEKARQTPESPQNWAATEINFAGTFARVVALMMRTPFFSKLTVADLAVTVVHPINVVRHTRSERHSLCSALRRAA